MSVVGNAFIGAVGRPSPRSPPGLTFTSGEQDFWEGMHQEIGSGFYLDGFLYLFGEKMEALLDVLPAWSFLVPALSDPMVIGYNAFGTLLVVKDRSDWSPRVGVLDAARVVWWDPPDMDFTGLLGTWIPDRRIPHFTDHAAYDAWRSAGGRRLTVGEMLSMKMPAALGGEFLPENFEITDIIRYYKASGPVYEKTAQAALGRKKPGQGRQSQDSPP